ncbi:MAG TPA: LysM peptidoglycan-binding domain-containing protein [Candidatus Sulfomarinibacteraceae bacterium]|nr:LysM peptidoglycan-binding domain-containing protein [Candidatus Sulfomarinibacteraceae bacterium]
MMNRSLLYTLLFICVVTLLLAAPPALAQSGNLLQNPSFEGGYSAYTPRTAQEHADCPDGICNTVQVPSGWYPWWVKEQSTDANPEYKSAGAPFHNRVREGGQAAQYFTFHRTHKAGFYQQVNVPANATVQFSIWGQAWVSNNDEPSSDGNAPINMRIGIDPYGGTDPYSPNIVWSGLQQPYDAYQQFVVQAQAQGSRVTVFTYSAPPFPMRHNDVYWDDASLVVVGQQPAPPPEQQPAPEPAPAPGDTPQTHTVQPGETLSAIARQYGVTVADIVAANNIANPNIIHSGQVLTLPGGAEAPAEQPAPAPTGIQATTQANLRLRSGPSTNNEILTVLPYGTTVPVQARNQAGDWIQVTYQGRVGWMAAWYTSISGDLNTVPVQ